MEERPSVIERAFQLARSGTIANVGELTEQLAAEGYGNARQILAGRSLSLQIARMITEARLPPRP